MNKTEQQAKKWLIDNRNLREGDIVKSSGTPDFLTPIGGFEVKKLYGDKIIFYSSQLEELTRFPGVRLLVFDGDGKLVKEAPYSEVDLQRGMLGQDIKIVQTDAVTVQVSKELVRRLQQIGKKGDTYSMIIQRLLDGKKGDADDKRGVTRDEHTGDSDQEKG